MGDEVLNYHCDICTGEAWEDLENTVEMKNFPRSKLQRNRYNFAICNPWILTSRNTLCRQSDLLFLRLMEFRRLKRACYKRVQCYFKAFSFYIRFLLEIQGRN